MNSDNIIGTEQFLDFMAGSAMIFSGFAITANSLLLYLNIMLAYLQILCKSN